MKTITHFLRIGLALLMSLTGCDHSGTMDLTERAKNQNLVLSDSVQLTALVRKAYAWRETKFRRNGFPFKLNTPTDSFFVGVDWNAYKRDITAYKFSNFFADDFFKTHRTIALTIDSSIKQANIEWRYKNDGISIWDAEADDWCNCQDCPDGYWEFMTLSNFRYGKDDITFNWTWGENDDMQPNSYQMKAKLEKDGWKISYIEGFTLYKSVAQYNQIMTANVKLNGQ